MDFFPIYIRTQIKIFTWKGGNIMQVQLDQKHHVGTFLL